jgi:DNA-directed RNA polymerase specialized sigma24 family protein
VTADGDVVALRQASDADASPLRARLAERVMPVIAEVVRRRLRDPRERQDADDLAHDALLQLFVKLDRLCASPDEAPIGDLDAYAAVVAERVCSAHVRRKWPLRTRLKNRVRYAVTRDPSLAAIDMGRGDWLCGLAEWPAPWRPAGSPRLLDLRVGGAASARLVTHGDPARLPLVTLVADVLRFAGGPVDLDDLISTLGDLLGIVDQPAAADRAVEDHHRDPARLVPDAARCLPDRLSDRAFIEALWLEIQHLPANQRRALLLNLRDDDGEDMVVWLPLVADTSIAGIAACLEMPVEEVRRLWDALPLDDLTLAARLGLTRQQVINLRKSARQRLGRRLRGWRT